MLVNLSTKNAQGTPIYPSGILAHLPYAFAQVTKSFQIRTRQDPYRKPMSQEGQRELLAVFWIRVFSCERGKSYHFQPSTEKYLCIRSLLVRNQFY